MSIFPKRTLQGGTVTIHWAIGMEGKGNVPLFPYVRIGVKAPDGKTVFLCDRNIQLLPENYEKEDNIADIKNVQQNLSRNTPVLILADYLSGRHKREQLVKILKRIRSARHFYFSYPVAEDAIPGKYELISELYLDGVCHKSVTEAEDFFYVEKIDVTGKGDKNIVIKNHSPEPCPIKIIEYDHHGASARLYHAPPLGELALTVRSPLSYLLYNEERESIPLQSNGDKRILRNQALQSFTKDEGETIKIYVMFPENDDAFILEGNYARIWELSDGTIPGSTLSGIDSEAYSSMLSADLLHEI